MAYTYDDFLAVQERMGRTLGGADLELAKKYPEVGISLLSLGEDYNKATTQEGKLLAHQAAEELRKSYGGYSGGQDGSGYIVLSQPEKQVADALGKVGSVGSFTYKEQAPTYENQYAEQQKQLLDELMNRKEFSYDKDEDPAWSSYKKSYLREGERASADALGKAAAATGGRPSSFAMTAASQAGDYYAAQLNDALAALEQQAYGRYVDEDNAMLQRLQQLNNQEQTEYAKYLSQLEQYNNDRNFALTQHQAGLDRAVTQLAAAQGQADTEYARRLAELERQTQTTQQAQSLAQGQVDAILAAGGTPSAELVAASGYSAEYVNALAAAAAAQKAAEAAANAGSGGGSGSGYNNGTLTAAQVKQLQTVLGVDADGFYGPASQAAAGGLSAEDAYALYIGGGELPKSPEAAAPDDTGKPSSGYNGVKATLDRAPGLTQLNKVSIIEDAYNNGRLTDAEVNQLLDHIGYGEV